VSASDLGTGRAQSVTVMPTTGLSEGDIERLVTESIEQAEADLIENASHGGGAGNPTRDAFTGEVEADEATARVELLALVDRVGEPVSVESLALRAKFFHHVGAELNSRKTLATGS